MAQVLTLAVFGCQKKKTKRIILDLDKAVGTKPAFFYSSPYGVQGKLWLLMCFYPGPSPLSRISHRPIMHVRGTAISRPVDDPSPEHLS